MGDLIRDLRFALRGLLRTPGFTAAAVLALALGIGATTAIFSVVHAVLVRSLGWGEESRLISIRGNFPGQDLFEIPVSAAEYLDLRRAPFLESVGLYRDATAALQGERAERVRAGYATGSFFATIGVQPLLGHAFEPEADRQGNEGSVMLSYAAWRKRFAGDPDVLGRTLTVNGKPRAIVGVLPAGFRWDVENEIWLPFGWSADEIANQRGSRGYYPIGRLRPGLTLAAASRGLDQLSAEVAGCQSEVVRAQRRLELALDADFAARPVRREGAAAASGALRGGALRAADRLRQRGQPAPRPGSGARPRESRCDRRWARPAAGWCASSSPRARCSPRPAPRAGCSIAVWSLDLLLAAAPPAIRQLADVRVSWALLGFASALTIVTTLVCGLAPALQVTRGDVSESLKDGGRTGSGREAGGCAPA